jgi:hypothetical protein
VPAVFALRVPAGDLLNDGANLFVEGKVETYRLSVSYLFLIRGFSGKPLVGRQNLYKGSLK